MPVPPICDVPTVSVEQSPEESLDAFDSEVSLGTSAGTAHVESTSDVDLFPSEQVAADEELADARSTHVFVPDAVVTADPHAAVVAHEPRAVLPEQPRVVTAIVLRTSVTLARRLALGAALFLCLGVTAVGMLVWHSRAPVVAPARVAGEAALPESRAATPAPAPTLLATPGPAALDPFAATPRREPLAPPPNAEGLARPEGFAARSRADTGASMEVPVSPGPVERAQAPTPGATGYPALPSPAARPLPSTRAPSVNSPVAPFTPALPMLPPAAPVSAPPVRDTGPPAAPTSAPARDAADIQWVLTRYTAAFSDLDAAAVSEVWPNADSRLLARAFRGLEQQGLAFDDCDIRVTDTSAAATCDGTVRYVTKVGSRDPRTERRRWQFTLEKVRDLWMIQAVESR